MRLEQWKPHQTRLNNKVFLETLPFPIEYFLSLYFLAQLIIFYCEEFVWFGSKCVKKEAQFQVNK